MAIACATEKASSLVCEQDLDEYIAEHRALLESVQRGRCEDRGFLGWLSVSNASLASIKTEAARVQGLAEVMVVVGIGGSNRAAVAALRALRREVHSPVSLYFAGDTLSAARLEDALELVADKSVVLNVIAKDFNTVEPGITFRMLRAAMEQKYGSSYARRIVVTGSDGPGQLRDLAAKEGYAFLPFPRDIGGRFSALTEVSLFPLAAAGVDVDALVSGAAAMEEQLRGTDVGTNAAVRYAAARNLLRQRGAVVEALVVFEPDLQDVVRWWIQLFAESEGKTVGVGTLESGRNPCLNTHADTNIDTRTVLFPVGLSFSEDLHAVGQYVQEGPRILMETFLDAKYASGGRIITHSPQEDGFGYLDGKPFDFLNTTVYHAALDAHTAGGVACIELKSDEPINAASLGALFYFFLFSVYCSAVLLGVNPFDQQGVEAYKRSMYHDLGKPGY